MDNSPPRRLRLQLSPAIGDAVVAFGLEQEGLFGGLPTLQGRLDSLLGKGDAICTVCLAIAFDGVRGELLSHSGVIWQAV